MTEKSKVFLITGASKGIGAATAQHLAALGHAVALAARSEAALEEQVSQIKADGGNALALACDVSNYDHVAQAVEQTTEAFGQLDVLVNNAGLIDPISRLEGADVAAWGQVVDVNLKGVFHGIRAVLPAFLAQRSGTIINISSGAATAALEGWSHYCATKAAVLSLTRCTHREVGDQGIVSVGLSPGTVATDMQRTIKASGINPVSQLDFDSHISPEWVAQAIAYLAGEGGKKHAGTDFSLKTEEGRAEIGLPSL